MNKLELTLSKRNSIFLELLIQSLFSQTKIDYSTALSITKNFPE